MYQLYQQLYENISLDIVYSSTITASVIGLLMLIFTKVTNRLDMYRFENMIKNRIGPQFEAIHENMDAQYEDLYSNCRSFRPYIYPL